MKRSLVLGVNGQDGSYLAETLLRRGHEVTGVGRDADSRYVAPTARFRYVPFDLRDVESLPRLVHEAEPDFAFHAAAVHGAAGFQYEELWRDMLAVNVATLHALLEHARKSRRSLRIIYAGSAKIFPAPLSGVIDEATPARASCLYSIGKIAARDLIMQYRAQHGIPATNLILFNHDSVRRPAQYFLPTIVNSIGRALELPDFHFEIKTLDFRADWSAAAELMDLAADIAEGCDEGELVLASGNTWVGRDAVRRSFARYGLQSDHHCRQSSPRADPGPEFRVSLQRLERVIGRRPTITLDALVDEMLAAARSVRPQETRNGR
jgi:GDPmannose 4,6-dehydratase